MRAWISLLVLALAGCGAAPVGMPRAAGVGGPMTALALGEHGSGAVYKGTHGVTDGGPSEEALEAAERLPTHVDLRDEMPPIRNQGRMESCTGFAAAGLGDFLLKRQHRSERLSPRFLYHVARDLTEGQYRGDFNVKKDSGALIRNAVKALDEIGACREESFPYPDLGLLKTPDGRVAQASVPPPAAASKEAGRFRLLRGKEAVTTLHGIRRTLADGLPVIAGMMLYDSFEGEEMAKTGRGVVPKLGAEKFHGGHAVLIVGYDTPKRVLIVRNSWGADWGDHGYFTLPYDFGRTRDANLKDEENPDGYPLLFDAWRPKLR